MTLAELKAQVARVFAEEQERHMLICDHTDEVPWCDAHMRARVEISYEVVLEGTHGDCQSFITQRGLEAVWRFMAESIGGDIMRVAAKGGHIKLESAALALEAVFGELGRQEG